MREVKTPRLFRARRKRSMLADEPREEVFGDWGAARTDTEEHWQASGTLRRKRP
ncbi:MAG: hypothetical protein ABSG68_04235 [Thermoguttaceae bacterium]